MDKLNETPVVSTENRSWSWSNIAAIAALIATLCSVGATLAGGVDTTTGLVLSGAGAAITAFLGRVQGTPVK